MADDLALEPSERCFYELLARAVVTNPFGEERCEIDRAIVGRSIPDSGKRVDAIVGLAQERMRQLASKGRDVLSRYRREDREILSFAFLFDLYHGLTPALDAHIAEQERAGDSPCDAPFASQALADLTARGFGAEEARRDLGLFFQIRRAFTFVDRALIGHSPCMQALRQALWNNIFTRDIRWYAAYLWERMEDFSTLLLGETGTGKGSAAKAIGRSGFIPFDPRKGRFAESFARAFVTLNVSQFPESLIESELFGHKKGAFTGAVEEHDGVFARCSEHGAIFLDELGELTPSVQIKLLQVLQERTFAPVGGRRRKRFRGRVIGATNREFDALRGEDGFRDDFFYRLCSDVIVMPPLRQRLEEAPAELELLVSHTLRRMLGADPAPLIDPVCTTIGRALGPDYAWHGNVRELEQCVRRILLKGTYEGDRRPVEPDRDPFLLDVAAGKLDASNLLAGYCARLHERLGSYEKVARRVRLDRRTVRKHVQRADAGS